MGGGFGDYFFLGRGVLYLNIDNLRSIFLPSSTLKKLIAGWKLFRYKTPLGKIISFSAIPRRRNFAI
jgi:hypothetical protein